MTEECCVCYESLSQSYLECGHPVHISCIERHFIPECPICRVRVEVAVRGTRPSSSYVFDPTEFIEDDGDVDGYGEEDDGMPPLVDSNSYLPNDNTYTIFSTLVGAISSNTFFTGNSGSSGVDTISSSSASNSPAFSSGPSMGYSAFSLPSFGPGTLVGYTGAPGPLGPSGSSGSSLALPEDNSSENSESSDEDEDMDNYISNARTALANALVENENTFPLSEDSKEEPRAIPWYFTQPTGLAIPLIAVPVSGSGLIPSSEPQSELDVLEHEPYEDTSSYYNQDGYIYREEDPEYDEENPTGDEVDYD